MKAAQYNKYGGPEVIEINENTPNPSVGDGQVLVEVYAASLNPFDWKLRTGYMKDMLPLQFPVTLGGDFSGVVVELGLNVTDYKVGDEVFGQALIINGGSGSLAEFACANTKNTTLKPKRLDYTQAASLPLVGASAVQALEEHIKLSKGQRILIHGGAGGIGALAIQLAKHLGAFVATTVGTDDIEYVRSLGADEVIDYKIQKFDEVLKDYDAVFDTAGGETTDRSFSVLKRGGVLVSMVGKPNEDLAREHGIVAIGQNSGVTSKRLKHLSDLVDKGVIKPQVDKVFPLDEAKKAFDYFENSHPKGKVVVKIKE